MKIRTIKALALVASIVCCASLATAEVSEKDFERAIEKYLQSDKGKETVGETVKDYFQSLQQRARKEQQAKAEAEMENQFKNPVNINAGKSPVKGPENARVTIIEFTDFQCPYCSKANQTVEQILKAYPKDVKVVLKNLPLPFHKEAKPAALAALAAGEQGKFWEMHDKLFENQKSLGKDFYKKAAKDLGLDVAKFEKDMKSKELEKQVDEDAALAKKHGIQGTPGFFVNGVAVKGAYPVDHFKKIIDRWLSESKKG